MSDKLKINITGPIFSGDGYSSHTRNLANALYKIADVKLSTQLMTGWERQVNDEELKMITKPGKENDVNIIISTPHYWKMFLGTGINCAYCIWEGDRVPESYIEEMKNSKIDYIFVASNHTKQAILNVLKSEEHKIYEETNKEIIDKIKIIPHGVDPTKFFPKEIKHDKFSFVSTKGWRGTNWDRGGVQYLIKAFCEEFRKDEQVELFIKLNPAYINQDILKQALTLMNLPEDRSLIRFVLDMMPYEKLVDVYNQSDVFICPTRSEAFNIPGLEAMACGLPTIQTNFGGQTDYMSDKNSLFINYELERVKDDLMYEEVQWAIPDINHLRAQMRWAFEHQNEIKQMGKQALEDSKQWTWEQTSLKIVDILKNA